MEALRISSRNRYLVFLAVAGAHAVVLVVLVGRSMTTLVPSAAGPPIATFLVLRPAVHGPLVPSPLSRISAPIAPIVEPITVAAPAPLATSPGGQTIDWNAAATRAAAATLKARKRISFGFPPGGKSAITLGVPSLHTPAHYAGESDRTVAGRDTEWTSGRCYVMSDPPVPGEPGFLRRARVSHFGCLPPAGPDPGELFKSLPAYKKYHPP